MLRSRLLLAAILATIAPGTVGAQPAEAPGIEGHWSGTLGKAPDQMRLEVNIHRKADGDLTGSVNGLDQHKPVYRIDAIEQRGMNVSMVIGEASGGYNGVLSEDGSTLKGAWSEIAIETPLVLTRSAPQPTE